MRKCPQMARIAWSYPFGAKYIGRPTPSVWRTEVRNEFASSQRSVEAIGLNAPDFDRISVLRRLSIDVRDTVAEIDQDR
jgi:hypothetical protein